MSLFTKRSTRALRQHVLNTLWAKGSLKSEGAVLMSLNYETRFSLQDIKTSWLHKKMLFHSSSKQANKIVSFNLTDIGEGINEVTVKEWFVKVGDKVSQFDNVCEVQSDKASVTITSRYDGIIRKIYYDVDDIASVGKPLVDIEVEEISGAVGISLESERKSTPITEEDKVPFLLDKILATPAVRRIAIENNIKLSSVSGSGKGGRVLKEDILEYLKKISSVSDTRTASETKCTTQESVTRSLATSDYTEPIQGFRKAMVKSMTESWDIPQFVYSDEIFVMELVKLLPHMKEIGSAKGIKVTYMPFFIKAASKALEKFPILNVKVDEACETLTYRKSHNIGVAMDTSNGLVVPNIKNVQELSLLEVAKEMNRLHELGKNGALRQEDLIDGTFTLSNIGARLITMTNLRKASMGAELFNSGLHEYRVGV
ncbi:lipoamide acyltransferase component of branched-chain alpha-keto acid dehydrogenase complex, mitochondrial isoform X2 [Cryptotermes secundus]|uniref:lipoamide acyltransferase component of branched-chain alpha-keto acid dehydrogenase complex, mitochondrial isoform X2 n=1 Tax=Cryptotermes secundus TaxID=105785 RepID=UPI000CD7B9C8|nr:lipoamide acyltransferase component of branched-chain alpha-keto acid dehydrogenase complex, mitochondrial isoform X2 [Cryptotermes secundus]